MNSQQTGTVYYCPWAGARLLHAHGTRILRSPAAHLPNSNVVLFLCISLSGDALIHHSRQRPPRVNSLNGSVAPFRAMPDTHGDRRMVMALWLEDCVIAQLYTFDKAFQLQVVRVFQTLSILSGTFLPANMNFSMN